MKRIVLAIIMFYQHYLSPVIHMLLGAGFACRYPVSCSTYARLVIEQYGVRKGVVLSLKRVLSCQPLGGRFYV